MSLSTDHAHCRRRGESFVRVFTHIRNEAAGVFDDLGTVLLAGLVLAGVIIAASTFDGDLQGKDEIVAAILGTLCLFAMLAALELADRIRAKRRR